MSLYPIGPTSKHVLSHGRKSCQLLSVPQGWAPSTQPATKWPVVSWSSEVTHGICPSNLGPRLGSDVVFSHHASLISQRGRLAGSGVMLLARLNDAVTFGGTGLRLSGLPRRL